jgi:hypothetical protein
MRKNRKRAGKPTIIPKAKKPSLRNRNYSIIKNPEIIYKQSSRVGWVESETKPTFILLISIPAKDRCAVMINARLFHSVLRHGIQNTTGYRFSSVWGTNWAGIEPSYTFNN